MLTVRKVLAEVNTYYKKFTCNFFNIIIIYKLHNPLFNARSGGLRLNKIHIINVMSKIWLDKDSDLDIHGQNKIFQ